MKRDGPISPADFAIVARLLYRMSGISLPDSKRVMVSGRLAERVRALGLAGFPDYCALLESAAGANEREQMLLALTTNITSFERECQQLDHFAREILPDLIARARAGGRVRIWSAACSTGEEAFSLAFRVLEACPEAGRLDIRILASDIDRRVIGIAQRAEYIRSSLTPLPEAVIARCFEAPDPAGGPMRVRSGVRDLVAFRVLNLVSDWPFRGLFDVIMCRNVAIYFDEAAQSQLWSRLAGQLNENGTLYIGHSENIIGSQQLGFVATGHSTFRRQPKGRPVMPASPRFPQSRQEAP